MKPETYLLIAAARRRAAKIQAHEVRTRTHVVQSTGKPMPPMVKPPTEDNKRLPGGLPPVPYRARNVWNGANKTTRSDGTWVGTRLDVFHTTSEWDKNARNKNGRVVGRFVAP